MLSFFKLEDADVSRTRATINFYCVVLLIYACVGGPIDMSKLAIFGSTEKLEMWKVYLFFTLILAYLNYKLNEYRRYQPHLDYQRLLREDERFNKASTNLTALLLEIKHYIDELKPPIPADNLALALKRIEDHKVATLEVRQILREYSEELVRQRKEVDNQSPEFSGFNSALAPSRKLYQHMKALEGLIGRVDGIRASREMLVSNTEEDIQQILQMIDNWKTAIADTYIEKLAADIDKAARDLRPFIDAAKDHVYFFDYKVPMLLSTISLALVWCPQFWLLAGPYIEIWSGR